MSDEATADALMGWRLVVGGGLGKQNRGEKREIVKLSNPMAVWQDSSRLKRGTLCITVFYNLMFKRISYWKVSTISPPVLGYTPLILWSVYVSEPSILSTLEVNYPDFILTFRRFR